MVALNTGVAAPPAGSSVQARFARQAAATPDAAALLWNGRSTSYAELDALADAVAQSLLQRGVGRGALVGVALQRSPLLVGALLGVLKAGAAYVPLDPSYPPQRLAYMVEDAALPLVLADAPTAALLPAAAPVLVLDGAVPHGAGAAAPGSASALDDLAYVIYTSGSTGRPKGAMVTQRGLLNYLEWAIDAYRVGAGDTVPLHTSIAFDLTVTSLFPALLVGARVELLAEEPGTQALARRLRAGPTCALVKITPAHLELLSRQLDAAAAARATRAFVIGGENLSAESLQFWRDAAPATRLINEYGPTETVVGCCVHEVGPADPRHGTVPIGRPIANTTLYVVDDALRPLPAGATGELLIGGAGVGRGYLGRPELSAERFVPDPFASTPGARLYRSGDLARQRTDGVFECLGRIDHQVKIQGYRIELGEIEEVLAGAPALRGCAVLARDCDGARQLVAYVVARPGARVDLDALRGMLRERLPAYMVPQYWVELDALPLTPNGKVDRDALPAPVAAPAAPADDRVALLLAIWREVLGVATIDPEDDLFDLGATSLSVLAAAARIRAKLGVVLELPLLFDNPSIAAQARLLGAPTEPAAPAAPVQAAASPLARIDRAGALPVSFSQRAMWILHHRDRRGTAYNVGLALRLQGPLDRVALGAALDALVARHEAFRTTFVAGDPDPLARIAPPAPARLLELEAAGGDAAAREADLLEQARALLAQPYDLARGPLHRFALGVVGPRTHLFVVAMHHIVSDAWSWRVVLDDLAVLYDAGRRGVPPALPPKPVDAVDIAAWQRATVDAARLQRQRAYWIRRLADGAPLRLPAGGDGSPRLYRARPLPPDWVDAVQRCAAAQRATAFMLLLAGFQALLARWCGQDDVAVLAPLGSRRHEAAEQVVGCLLNSLVLRTRIAPRAGFEALLAQVRDVVLDAFANSDLPYDELVASLRAAGPWQEPRAMFNLLEDPWRAPRFDELDAAYVLRPMNAASFDLHLSVTLGAAPEIALLVAPDVTDAATADRLLDVYLRSVRRWCDDPRAAADPGAV